MDDPVERRLLQLRPDVGRRIVTLSLMIRSHYYRGLLVLLRRDRIIDVREKELMLKIGEILDFDRRFCEATIDELMSNAHITRDPVLFRDENIRQCFFRDALRVALVDGKLHPSERRWLRSVARANGKTSRWLDALIREFREKKDVWAPNAPLEIQQYM